MVSITNDIGGNAYGQYYSYSEIKDANGNVIEGSLNNAIDGLPTRFRTLGVNTDYAYDSLNRLTRRNVDLTNDIQTLYTYKDSLRGSGYTTTQLATEKLGEISYGYNYDNMGNITSITKGSNAYKSYMYDSLGQLIQEQNISNSTMTSYSYNHLGNITAKHINDYNGINEKAIVQYGYSADSDAGWKYLLTSITTTDYTNDSTTTETIDYDAIGNPISYRGAAMAWRGRQLTGYAKNGVTSTFKYDADGLRSSKTVGGVKTEYQYVGDQLFYEKRGDSQEFYYFYDSYGNLSTIYYTLNNNGTTSRAVYHALTNAQGDVVALYNSAGNLVAQYEYDAWGNTLSVKDALGVAITAWYNIAVANPIRYRGYYYDADLGLYYLQSRYYDSDVGRFINADGFITTGQGVLSYNMYAYCMNNPVMYSDPSGVGVVLAIVIGAGIGFVAGIIFGDCFDDVVGTTTSTSSAIEYDEIVNPVIPAIIEEHSYEVIKYTDNSNTQKPVDIYVNHNGTDILSSSVGVNVTCGNVTKNINFSADNIGVYHETTYENITYSTGIKFNLIKFRVGIETATEIQWDNVVAANSSCYSISGWWLCAAVYCVYSGMSIPTSSPIPSPSPANVSP